LTLPAGIADDHPADSVEPVALMPDLHVLPGVWTANIGYSKLLTVLRSPRFGLVEAGTVPPDQPVNLLPVPYDWRLSNRFNARRLKSIVEPALERWRSQGGVYANAGLVFVCHSMGGLIARWYIEHEGGAENTRKLITLGTPHRGALSALAQLVNGVRKGIGPLAVDLTEFARSLPSLYQLLPEYACIESPSGLLRTTQTPLASLSSAMVADGMRFHEDLDAAGAPPEGSWDLHLLVGFRQSTATTARLIDGRVEPVTTIEGVDESGDATVPRLAATPQWLRPNSPSIVTVADRHGSLQSNQSVFDVLEGILTTSPVIHMGPTELELSVAVEELVLAGEPLEVWAVVTNGARVGLQASVFDERDRRVSTARLQGSSAGYRADLGPFPAGAYRVVVEGIGSAAARVAPVTALTLVWEGGDA
jgi:pimeloyl-ACP methyl ester carboxylesterase